MAEVNHLLTQIEAGDKQASEDLLPVVYDELRKLAKSRMAAECSDHTLQTTALVHEAYLRLVDRTNPQSWDSKGHFFSAAAEAMRRILVEYTRRKLGKQRGGHLQKRELHDNLVLDERDPELILEIDEAIGRLREVEPLAAQLVNLHCFGGISIPESAKMLGIPVSTAYNEWAYAKALMAKMLS
jgi:RNA polymerase sigma factor (TIGR02999 family)